MSTRLSIRLLLVASLLLFSFQSALAQALPCGNIIAPENPYDSSSPLKTTAIEDCADPFGVTSDPPNPYSVTINGAVIAPGAVVAVPEGRTNDIGFVGVPTLTLSYTMLFKHTNNNYEYVSRERGEPTLEQYRAFADTYFSTPGERDLYLAIVANSLEGNSLSAYFYNPDTGEDIIDGATGETVENRFNNFNNDFYLTFDDSVPYIEAGTYTMLFNEDQLEVTHHTLWETLRQLVIPTAYAQCQLCTPSNVYAITFTLTETLPEPTGASSVLFLPGIQASRLYTDGFLGTENQLWEPNRDADVEKLILTPSGESVNNIYTKDVLDEAFGIGNIYQSFLDLLEELKAEGAIVDYEPFAYDWRYDVFTVATKPVLYPNGEEKVLVEEIKRLAAESHTGKVTIVAHSNGGLVAKALMNEYQDTELAGLIEKVIFVATPQIGTPKAIGSLLHGLDQGLVFGLLVTPQTARATSQFLPGAYGLLPARTYFETVGGTLITSDNSATAQPVTSYGDLNNYENFVAFLTDEHTTRSEVTNITQPITLNRSILDTIITQQSKLSAWEAPAGVQVFEVAGTGVGTIDGFNYREFSCKDNPNCVLLPFLKPVPTITFDGDETVVLRSATAYAEDKITYEVNLQAESAGVLNKDITHANITESDAVLAFLESALLYPQLTDTLRQEEFGTLRETYTLIGVHSPVSIVVKNAAGKILGVVGGEIKEQIPGGAYFEFAGSKYVLIPDTEGIEVLLTGEASGRYSLTIESVTSDGEQELIQEIIGATSTPGMQVRFECMKSTCGELVVDYDGNGVRDGVFDWAGTYSAFSIQSGIDDEENKKQRSSTGTRVRAVVRPNGQVQGVATSIPQAERERMWEQLLGIEKLILYLQLLSSVRI